VVKKKLSLAEILHKNRYFVLAMLGVPVIGMAIASLLILYKKPENMVVVLGVILFVAVQYILMMFFWLKRVEHLATKQTEENIVSLEYNEEDQKTSCEVMLLPEEERIFPVA